MPGTRGDGTVQNSCHLTLFSSTTKSGRYISVATLPTTMNLSIMQELGANTDIDPGGIFKCFFQSKPVGADSAATPPATKLSGTEDIHASQKNLPQPKSKVPSHTIRVLDETELSELAKRLADAIPEFELSVSFLK
jgi:hypothetical protein